MPLGLAAACGYLALGLLAFVVTVVALRPLSSAETRPLGIAKLEGFLRQPGRYDVVAVGNSRVYRHIVPAVLESELDRRGVAARAYNLGASMMSFDELAYLLREAVRRRKGDS